MEAPHFDEIAFFTALDSSGARALLIGRRALVLLGLPVLTADYDFWIAAVPVNFDDLWSARRRGKLSTAAVWIPSVDGLMLTKQVRSTN